MKTLDTMSSTVICILPYQRSCTVKKNLVILTRFLLNWLDVKATKFSVIMTIKFVKNTGTYVNCYFLHFFVDITIFLLKQSN